MPGRPPRPRLVPVRELPQRGFGSVEGRAAFMHAIAHIEFNAIDLAWDAVYRFRGLPDAYYADWVGVANDEARHFAMLRERLRELRPRLRRLRRAQRPVGDGGKDRARRPGAHGAGAARAGGARARRHAGHDRQAARAGRRRHRGYPRGDPARGNRARRCRVALVPLVVRARRHRSARCDSASCWTNTRAGACAGRSTTRRESRRGSRRGNLRCSSRFAGTMPVPRSWKPWGAWDVMQFHWASRRAPPRPDVLHEDRTCSIHD